MAERLPICHENIKLDGMSRKIVDLPEPIRGWAAANQVKQGNRVDVGKVVSTVKIFGNFDWNETTEGEDFWIDVYGDTPIYDLKEEYPKLPWGSISLEPKDLEVGIVYACYNINGSSNSTRFLFKPNRKESSGGHGDFVYPKNRSKGSNCSRAFLGEITQATEEQTAWANHALERPTGDFITFEDYKKKMEKGVHTKNEVGVSARDMKAGEVYVNLCSDLKVNRIFVFDRVADGNVYHRGTIYPVLHRIYTKSVGSSIDEPKNYRLATFEEACWLKECINQGKYMSKEVFELANTHFGSKKYPIRQEDMWVKTSNSNSNLNKSNHGNSKKEGSSIEISKIVSRVCRGQRPSGDTIRGRSRTASIESRRISYSASVIAS